MTAASTLPLRPNTATAGICWDHRLVLGAFGAPKMRQRHGLQVGDRLPHSRQPIISRAARDTWKCGCEIRSSEAGKLFRECHHLDPTPQRKIRNAENPPCSCPHCGHNKRVMSTSEQMNLIRWMMGKARHEKHTNPDNAAETVEELHFRGYLRSPVNHLSTIDGWRVSVTTDPKPGGHTDTKLTAWRWVA